MLYFQKRAAKKQNRLKKKENVFFLNDYTLNLWYLAGGLDDALKYWIINRPVWPIPKCLIMRQKDLFLKCGDSRLAAISRWLGIDHISRMGVSPVRIIEANMTMLSDLYGYSPALLCEDPLIIMPETMSPFAFRELVLKYKRGKFRMTFCDSNKNQLIGDGKFSFQKNELTVLCAINLVIPAFLKVSKSTDPAVLAMGSFSRIEKHCKDKLQNQIEYYI